MARIMSDSNTGMPIKYITGKGNYKIIPRGDGKDYIIRCPHKDCRAEIDLRELDKLVGLTSVGEACPICGKDI